MPQIPMVEENPLAMAPVEAPPIQFGRVTLSASLKAFRRDLNADVMALLQSLPEAVHADAVVCLIKHFGTPVLPEFDFFRNYYTPAWSILYWLEQRGAARGPLSTEDRRQARTAHAMALFLHPLDDHLNDGQLTASHLHLLLRSQAWLRMQAALREMAAGVADGADLVRGFSNCYYASITTPPTVATLDGYCDHFQRQMTTWMSAPALMMRKMALRPDDAETVQAAYASFGTAWRLLDDWQDSALDMETRSHSSVYVLLPEDARQCWDQAAVDPEQRQRLLWEAMYRERVFVQLKKRICTELQSAAARLETCGLSGMAEELRCLAAPVEAMGAVC